MTFTVRDFNLERDEVLLRNFAKMRGETLPKEIMFLPPTGVIVFFRSEPVCLGFQIHCDNGMAMNSDFYSNPELPKTVRNEGVEFMRARLYEKARDKGLQFVTAFTKHEKLAERLVELGFRKMDTGYTQLGRFLWL